MYLSSPPPNANSGCRNNSAGKGDNGNGSTGRVSGGDRSSDGDEGPRGQEEDDARRQRQQQQGSGGEGLRDGERVDGGVLVLQARSRRETLLWAKVLQVTTTPLGKHVVFVLFSLCWLFALTCLCWGYL